MTKSDDIVPNYLGVFDQKLTRLRGRIQKELELPKKDRSKHHLKKMVEDANGLKKVLKRARKTSGLKCPHCGETVFD